MKVLLLVSGALEPRQEAIQKPATHYCIYSLADHLTEQGAKVDLIDYDFVKKTRDLRVRTARRIVNSNAAIAMCSLIYRKKYDVVFTLNDSISVPLAMLMQGVQSRPAIVALVHRLTAPLKQILLRMGRNVVDQVLTYSPVQQRHSCQVWGVSPECSRLIMFFADTEFYRPESTNNVAYGQICSVGAEWRDYETLLRAVAPLPDINLTLDPHSPWTKRPLDLSDQDLSSNVRIQCHDNAGLKMLYASSMFCVVPLQRADFAAGTTTILEGMAMGKPVVATSTPGMHTGIIQDGENGLLVPPQDPEALRMAIVKLWSDPDLCIRMGRNARQWVEQNATVRQWTHNIVTAINSSCGRGHQPWPQ